MTPRPLRLAVFGSSLLSAYWNGAATYYRGILKALAERGHHTTFYEPETFSRQEHRDIDPPPWCDVVVYPCPDGDRSAATHHLEAVAASEADVVIKTSNIGIFDAWLEAEVLRLRRPGRPVLFWDVDAPATLDRMDGDPADPFRPLVPGYDYILTYGGGQPVIDGYTRYGARGCLPVYNALDPDTHHPVPPQPERFTADLGFLGNRMPDREARVDAFFLETARQLPGKSFLLGGSGWEQGHLPPNVRHVGHVYARDHNAFNCTPRAVLNINRAAMARYGFSPPTRVFEAAGAGACLFCDHWEGIELFLTPGEETLVARDAAEIAAHLEALSPERARAIGDAARRRVLAEHTYRHRAEQLESTLLALR